MLLLLLLWVLGLELSGGFGAGGGGLLGLVGCGLDSWLSALGGSGGLVVLKGGLLTQWGAGFG